MAENETTIVTATSDTFICATVYFNQRIAGEALDFLNQTLFAYSSDEM